MVPDHQALLRMKDLRRASSSTAADIEVPGMAVTPAIFSDVTQNVEERIVVDR